MYILHIPYREIHFFAVKKKKYFTDDLNLSYEEIHFLAVNKNIFYGFFKFLVEDQLNIYIYQLNIMKQICENFNCV